MPDISHIGELSKLGALGLSLFANVIMYRMLVEIMQTERTRASEMLKAAVAKTERELEQGHLLEDIRRTQLEIAERLRGRP